MQIKSLFLFGTVAVTAFAAECYDHKGSNWAKSDSSRHTAAWVIRQYICGGGWSGGCIEDQHKGAWGLQSVSWDGSGGFGGYGACWDAMGDIISQCTRNGYAGGTWTLNGAEFEIGTY